MAGFRTKPRLLESTAQEARLARLGERITALADAKDPPRMRWGTANDSLFWMDPATDGREPVHPNRLPA